MGALFLPALFRLLAYKRDFCRITGGRRSPIIATANTTKRQYSCLYFAFETQLDNGDFELTIGIMYTNFSQP